jgi:dihydrofolate synthase/folylpolyglutamate synthase
MFQRIGAAAYNNTLDNSLMLDEMFEYPHHAFSTVHVGGTNGKGSVSHTLASVLQEAGWRVGLYTSPHLTDFRERIRINGTKITENAVVNFVDRFINLNVTARIKPSFFELCVCMAFDWFRQQNVQIAIIEVGLGGRLDSTNIITPEISIITNVSFDHTALLGRTLPKIATEKAGIIKPKVPVVVSESNMPEVVNVFGRRAAKLNSPIWYADREYQASLVSESAGLTAWQFEHKGSYLKKSLETDMMGHYQKCNLQCVMKTLDLLTEKGWLPVNSPAIQRGLRNVKHNTGLRGRWDILCEEPLLICDTGHNAAGISAVMQQLDTIDCNRLHIVFGLVSDKDVKAILPLLPKTAHYYFTCADVPRAMPSEVLRQEAEATGLHGNSYPTVSQAVNAAKSTAKADDAIFVGGSSFVVADLLKMKSFLEG